MKTHHIKPSTEVPTMQFNRRRPRPLAGIAALVALVAVASVACNDSPTSPEGPEGLGTGEANEVAGGGEASEGSGGAGEPGESGTQWAPSQIADETNQGAHLLLSYDALSDVFVGTVENTTTGILSQVRVEVHLSNGVELGPTTPTDLNPGQVLDVMLSAAGNPFVWFTVHPEVG